MRDKTEEATVQKRMNLSRKRQKHPAYVHAHFYDIRQYPMDNSIVVDVIVIDMPSQSTDGLLGPAQDRSRKPGGRTCAQNRNPDKPLLPAVLFGHLRGPDILALRQIRR